jgi:YD repeat-containing protein
VTLTDQAGGTGAADAVKLVRDNAGNIDTEDKSFDNGYDPDGNLVALTDSSRRCGGGDSYAVSYDGPERVSRWRRRLARTSGTPPRSATVVTAAG